MSDTPTNAFKPIADAAEATDALLEVEDQQGLDDDEAMQNAEDHPVEEIESLCMQCGENGATRILLTFIPYFKEVIIMSFRCQHCGFHNNEIQSAGQVHELGSMYTAKITTKDDMDRQLVKSEFATLSIPEFELTLPPGKGQLTTIESVIRATIEDLEFEQPVRQHTDAATYAKIEELLNKLRPLVAEPEEGSSSTSAVDPSTVTLEKTFTVKLDDPTGNSFIEAKGGYSDPKWQKRQYRRTAAQNEQIGLARAGDIKGAERAATSALDGAHHENSRDAAIKAAQEALHSRKTAAATASPPHRPAARTANGQTKRKFVTAQEVSLTDDFVASNPDEVYSFPDVCSSCGATLETYMKSVDIPHFKEVVLMSTNCHSCGYRDNEIKSGGAIAEKGRKIVLKVEDSDDLSRDVLKSETAALTIPEIELHLQPGTLGGRFTTLEGLLNQVYEELDEKVFARGDAARKGEASEMETFLGKLKAVMNVARPFSVVLDDPLANSYIQNLYAPDDDPNMETEEYERSHDQNEELGLNDILVTDYHGEAEAKEAREEADRLEAQAMKT